MSTLLLLRVISVVFTHGVTLFLMGEIKRDKKKTAIIESVIAFCCLVIGILIMSWLGWSIISISILYAIYVVCYVFVYCFLFKGPVSKNFFIISTYTTYFMFVVSLSGWISFKFFDGSAEMMLLIRTVISLFYIAALLAGLRNKIRIATSGIENGWNSMALFSFISFLVVSLFSIINVFISSASYYVCLFLLFLTISAAYSVIFRMVSLMRADEELSDMKLRQMWLESELETEKIFVQRAKAMRHDVRHHNRMLLELINEGKFEEAKNYLGDYEISISEDYQKWSDNIAIDALIRIAKRRADAISIAFRAKVDVPAEIDIKEIDLVTLLGNILDNAIEASSMEKNGFIDLNIINENGRMKIEMRNSLSEDIAFDSDGIPISNKGSGLGLRNVRNIVNKYDGMLRMIQENNTFLTQIIM